MRTPFRLRPLGVALPLLILKRRLTRPPAEVAALQVGAAGQGQRRLAARARFLWWTWLLQCAAPAETLQRRILPPPRLIGSESAVVIFIWMMEVRHCLRLLLPMRIHRWMALHPLHRRRPNCKQLAQSKAQRLSSERGLPLSG